VLIVASIATHHGSLPRRKLQTKMAAILLTQGEAAIAKECLVRTSALTRRIYGPHSAESPTL